jgi:hypothetical protein
LAPTYSSNCKSLGRVVGLELEVANLVGANSHLPLTVRFVTCGTST